MEREWKRKLCEVNVFSGGVPVLFKGYLTKVGEILCFLLFQWVVTFSSLESCEAWGRRSFTVKNTDFYRVGIKRTPLGFRKILFLEHYFLNNQTMVLYYKPGCIQAKKPFRRRLNHTRWKLVRNHNLLPHRSVPVVVLLWKATK